MSQSVTLFRLMIASPGDVNTERMMLQDVIYKWNSNNTLEKSIVILPLMWEIDSPRGVADESQSLIDEHMLVNSDMVIGLFYSTLGRYGRTEYNTIGEIKKHIEKGTQVVLFFREPPIPAGYEQATEIAKVLDFKENLQSSLGIDAIYYDYKSESEFQANAYMRIDKAVQTYLIKKASSSCLVTPRFCDVVIKRSTIQSRIFDAKESIFISGASLISTLTTNFEHSLLKSIHVRLLMTDDDRDLIRRCAQLSYTSLSELTGHIHLTLEHFKAMGKRPWLEIRCINAVMPVALVGIDINQPSGKIYIQQYLYGADPADSPNFVCYSGDPWFRVYYNQIEALWRDSTSIPYLQ